MTAALAYGWSRRGQFDFVAEEGLGYALGVVGLAMMTLLLAYSLRKRWGALRNVGPSPLWLKVHMMLGLVGPTAILYHANFRLGSLNSRAALFCMLVVSGSGVVGRFLYTRIHYGYLDQRRSLAELQQRVQEGSDVLSRASAIAPEISELLADFEQSALPGASARRGRSTSARRMRTRALRAYRRARVKGSDAPKPRAVGRALRRHAAAVRRVKRFSVYERAFALWHAFHLPFCLVLFLAAAVHVVAVHMY